MESKKIEVETRKVKAEWNKSMAKDLSSFHGFDKVQELENKMIEELRRELDPAYKAELKRKEREKKLERIFKKTN